jgi:hypothetical protein
MGQNLAPEKVPDTLSPPQPKGLPLQTHFQASASLRRLVNDDLPLAAADDPRGYLPFPPRQQQSRCRVTGNRPSDAEGAGRTFPGVGEKGSSRPSGTMAAVGRGGVSLKLILVPDPRISPRIQAPPQIHLSLVTFPLVSSACLCHNSPQTNTLDEAATNWLEPDVGRINALRLKRMQRPTVSGSRERNQTG